MKSPKISDQPGTEAWDIFIQIVNIWHSGASILPEHCSCERIRAPSNWWLTIFRLGFTQRMKLEPCTNNDELIISRKAHDKSTVNPRHDSQYCEASPAAGSAASVCASRHQDIFTFIFLYIFHESALTVASDLQQIILFFLQTDATEMLCSVDATVCCILWEVSNYSERESSLKSNFTSQTHSSVSFRLQHHGCLRCRHECSRGTREHYISAWFVSSAVSVLSFIHVHSAVSTDSSWVWKVTISYSIAPRDSLTTIRMYYGGFVFFTTLCDKRRNHTDLEFVSHTDETEFARFLFGVLGAAGVLKQRSNKVVFGLTN